jgi:hypothetical protein
MKDLDGSVIRITTMSIKKLFISFFFTCCIQMLSAQPGSDYLLWSAFRKLSVDDFGIKTKQAESTLSFAQFTLNYEVRGFSFLAKNFNKKVKNYFMPGASWIDTTTGVATSLRYQQTLFDLCEIYARQFRQALQQNRKKFLKGTDIADELNKQYMSAFSKRRIEYDRETSFGTKEARQAEWEAQIQQELQQLSDYAYDK